MKNRIKRIVSKQSNKNKVSLEGEIEFKKLVDLLPEIVARTDKELNVIFLNKYGLKATGYTKEDIKKGLNVFEVIKDEDKHKARKDIEKVLKRQKISLNEYTVVRKDGSNFQVLVNSNAISGNDGAFLGLRIVAIDLTEKKRTEEKIKESEQRCQFLAENVNDIIFVQNMNLGIEYVSPSATRLFGYKLEDKDRIKMKDIMTKDSYKKAISSFKKYVALARKDAAIDVPLMEYEYMRKDGSTFWGELKVGFLRNPKGSLTGSLGVLRDVTERKRVEEKLKYMSFHDNLTGLFNRTYFEEELKRLNTKRQLPLSIIVGDVNGLKLVNDAFGHLKGDLYLCEAARILEESCRREDIIARWGGDEFSIILPKTKREHAYKIIKRIRSAASRVKSDGIPLSISLGTSTKEQSDQDINTVMQSAENNMYSRKLVERKSISSSIISALERTLWEKSHETREHAERIKKLAIKLGNSINLYQNKLDELILLSALHDIGKIAISEDILNKSDKLTEREWRRIKKHPEIGYNICESSPQLVVIAEAVLAHHEWWDGSGYPLGLKGEDIPITSRIIAIADSYDVMTTGRNYKEPLSKDEAIKELRRYSGIQFDPKLVKNFIEILKESKEN